jgi:CheY-like chemotaxis protein
MTVGAPSRDGSVARFMRAAAAIQGRDGVIHEATTGILARLRAETRVEHDAIERVLDLTSATLGLDDYRRRLSQLHAVETTRPLVEAGEHALDVHTPAAPVWVHGDLTRLAQVVGNLLNNAAKYTPRGGHIALWAGVERSEAPGGPWAVVRVTDDGVGIAAEMLPRVFDLFAQGDRTLHRAQGGLGIGLSLVRRLVEMHGGTIAAHSEGLGRGSTFTVRLPLASEGEEGTQRAAPITDEGTAQRSARRVLVVDDNLDAAETLSMLLSIKGHETFTAHSGPEALALAQACRPEVVFLDIGMPGMDGYEVARRLRVDPATAGALLVALTGWGSEEDARRSREAGFDVHLTKPVEPAALAEVLATAAVDRGG